MTAITEPAEPTAEDILRDFRRAAVLVARASRTSPAARLRGARRAAMKWTQR